MCRAGKRACALTIKKAQYPGHWAFQAEVPYCLRLAGCRKRPGGLRVQSSLSRRGSRCSRCFGSGCFRGFLRSRLFRGFLRSGFFRYFLGCSLFRWCFFGSSFFRWCFFGGSFFRWCFFSRRFFSGSFFGRSLFSYYFFRWCFFSRRFFSRRFFSSSFFRRGLLRRYFFRWCFRWCSFFSRRFFRSCHSFLLDHVAKSTSRLEYAKRFTALGHRITGPSAANTGAKPNARSVALSLVIAILEIIFVVVLSRFFDQSQDRAPPD